MPELVAIAALFFVFGLLIGSVLGRESRHHEEPTEHGPFGR